MAKAVGNEHYAKSKRKAHAASDTAQPSLDVKIIEERELYDIKLLSIGELALVTMNRAFFAPSELDRFLRDLKKAQQQMDRLRETANV